MRRPITAVVLATLQFLAAGAVVIVRLGDGTLDGALTVGDIVSASAIALVGAVVVGATWSGHRAGWYFELLLALALGITGGIAFGMGSGLAPAALVGGLLWLALLLLPMSRTYYLRPAID